MVAFSASKVISPANLRSVISLIFFFAMSQARLPFASVLSAGPLLLFSAIGIDSFAGDLFFP
jgi:hypothetical protein